MGVRLSGTGESTYSTFGRLLQAYRRRGTVNHEGPISRSALSRILDGIVSPVTIEKYERGERRPPPHFIPQLARALELTTEQEAELVQAAGVDMVTKYLEEYQEISGNSRTNQDVPGNVKRELADALAPTSQFAVRLAELGDPGFRLFRTLAAPGL